MLSTPPPIYLKALERKGKNSTKFLKKKILFFLIFFLLNLFLTLGGGGRHHDLGRFIYGVFQVFAQYQLFYDQNDKEHVYTQNSSFYSMVSDLALLSRPVPLLGRIR